LYITESVCLSVFPFLTHGYSFERIWTKFGMWHLYIFPMVMSRLASAARKRRLALRASSVCVVANGWQYPSRNLELANGRRNGERRRREGEPLVTHIRKNLWNIKSYSA